MNGVENITNILTSAGLTVVGADSDFIYLEDPACVVRAFERFANYAWIVVCLITVLLLFVWAVSMIRGVDKSAETASKNFVVLMILFGVLFATGPILNFFYRGDLFGAWCKQIPVSIDNINSLLSQKIEQGDTEFMLYEGIEISDTGPQESAFEVDMQGAKKSLDNLEKVSAEIDKELSSK